MRRLLLAAFAVSLLSLEVSSQNGGQDWDVFSGQISHPGTSPLGVQGDNYGSITLRTLPSRTLRWTGLPQAGGQGWKWKAQADLPDWTFGINGNLPNMQGGLHPELWEDNNSTPGPLVSPENDLGTLPHHGPGSGGGILGANTSGGAGPKKSSDDEDIIPPTYRLKPGETHTTPNGSVVTNTQSSEGKVLVSGNHIIAKDGARVTVSGTSPTTRVSIGDGSAASVVGDGGRHSMGHNSVFIMGNTGQTAAYIHSPGGTTTVVQPGDTGTVNS